MNLDAKGIYAQVKANNDLLESCSKHDFGNVSKRLFGAKVTCKNCGGKMNISGCMQYAQGYKAAGGDINDVVQLKD